MIPSRDEFPGVFPVLARAGLVVAIVFFSLPRPLAAQQSLVDLPSFREGCQALADERFATAVEHFRDCWRRLSADDSGETEKDFVAVRLLESLVRNGEAAAALEWIGEQAMPQDLPAANLWIARAYEAEERFAEAAEHYNLYLASLSGTARHGNAPAINRAVALARSDRAETAFELVHEVVTPETPEESLRLAQLAAAAQKTAEALAYLDGIPPEVAESDSLRLPSARLRLHLLDRAGKADESLALAYALVESSPDSDSARQAFLLLEQLLDEKRPDDLEGRLAEWESKPDFPGRAAAALFRILLLGEEAARPEHLTAFAEGTDDPSLAAEARLRIGEDEAALSGASDLPSDLHERIDHHHAAAAFRARAFDLASERFLALAESAKGTARERFRFNAAVATLRDDDAEAFVAHESAFALENPRSPLLADLDYLGGLYFAAKADARAFDRLSHFIADHPEHPLQVEARLALAEIHLNQAPARPEAARVILEGLRTRPLTLAQSERLDYTTIWVELTASASAELLRRSAEFVTAWPSSGYLEEVLMILASEHYARKNLAAAAESFGQLAKRFPDSTHAETARFFEAKASPANDAAAKWSDFISKGGELAAEARHEYALLLVSMDRFSDAKAEFEGLLADLPATSPLRHAAMSDLGYAVYLEALAKDHDQVGLEDAANHFATLSRLTDAPAFWRYNAAVRRGKCLEALGRSSVALEIYRSIVEETSRPGGETELAPRETEWVFRAGFASIEILVAEKNWPAAIAIADALSEKSGPRAIEARRLAEKLRLKHWVWD